MGLADQIAMREAALERAARRSRDRRERGGLAARLAQEARAALEAQGVAQRLVQRRAA